MPKKILIVDDDPIIVKYLQAIFSDNGYSTCVAGSSMEGLERVRLEKPDLITLDIQMPASGGPGSTANCAWTRS
jgi:CheY-like chemotaxis protein